MNMTDTFTKVLNEEVMYRTMGQWVEMLQIHDVMQVYMKLSNYKNIKRTPTVPRTHNRFGDRSFAVAGPRLWNSLPISLRKISSYGQFRR